MKVKKGDNVIIIAGRDKGKKGKIVRSIPKDSKVIVEGVNMMKKHRKAKTTNEKGSMTSIAMPIHVSNVKKAE